jgi:hypothetical protein
MDSGKRLEVIKYLESVLTDDPDIILELDASMDQPMDASNAATVTPTADVDADMDAELEDTFVDETREDNLENNILDREQEMRSKMLKPQIDTLNKSLDKMDDGLMQNQKVTSNADDRSMALDREIANIKAMMQQLERNAI